MTTGKIFELLNKDEIVELLQKMIKFKTVNPPGDETPLAEFLADEMISFGMEAAVERLNENRANVTGRLRGTGERKSLLFNGHLDTVPPGDIKWEYSPYSAEVIGNKIFGRGSADMKSGLAAMIIAAKAIKESNIELKGDLIISATAGEETDSIGSVRFLENGGLDGVGAIVIGEPSSCGINVSEKGAFWLKITTYGKTAHGAFPYRGINAIVHMNALIAELVNYKFTYKENKLLGYPTMNISTIKGGVKTNVVPDACEVTIDIRTVPGMKHQDILSDLLDIISMLKNSIEGFNASIEVLNDRPSVETLCDDPFVMLAKEVIEEELNKVEEPKGVNFYTDASVFLPATNLPAIFYGPGDAEMAHQPNEYVQVDRVLEAAKFYAAIAIRYLSD